MNFHLLIEDDDPKEFTPGDLIFLLKTVAMELKELKVAGIVRNSKGTSVGQWSLDDGDNDDPTLIHNRP